MSKNYFVVIIFLALLQPQTVIAKKLLTSSEQPLAIIISGPVVQKLHKAIHWVNHYPVRVTDFLGG